MFNSRTDIKSFLSTLVRVIHINVEFLVLDEPINRRNIPAREALEKYLDQFNSRLLVASYDRYFLDKITNRITGPTARRFTIIRTTSASFRIMQFIDSEFITLTHQSGSLRISLWI